MKRLILLPLKIIMYILGASINIFFGEQTIVFGNDTIINYYKKLESKLINSKKNK